MSWVKLKSSFATEEKAQKAAGIVVTTEGRLASEPGGPQYDVETRIEQGEDGWHVYWRKVFTGYDSGCGGGGCGSCGDSEAEPQQKAKIIPFPVKHNNEN
ncbi:hypothetical protein [Dethiobacter alkaliphilus]|uniref:Uncharacterized protein n=1 Tax=Dethiobacter alkaliphilus AHT 1 TaxID=555088 RepID=C0GJ74_DETAL|nr:hypothetical protein [Dethiobacter alkaliphilus]EEG76559.1 hypothetical protein DealDRAFT_2533 [Dethiobacter alkaliphilus AHT 1]